MQHPWQSAETNQRIFCKIPKSGRQVILTNNDFQPFDNQIHKKSRLQGGIKINSVLIYFLAYITSFTSFTVRGTSGSAAATRFGA